MDMSSYCYNKGMTFGEYENFKSNINSTGDAIIQIIKENYKTGTGMYYDIAEILNQDGDKMVNGFIIQNLKSKGVEFYDNNTLWRY